MSTKQGTICVCDRCGHEWFPSKSGVLPARCAKCESRFWNENERPGIERTRRVMVECEPAPPDKFITVAVKVDRLLLEPLRNEVRLLEDAPPPAPPYGDVHRLARFRKGFTGYTNSTDVESMTEANRIKFWRQLQTRARNKLAAAEAKYPAPTVPGGAQ